MAQIWGNDTFDQPFHDNWWQTETGGIMIANYAAMDVKPGSIGKPLPGITVGTIETEGDRVIELTAPMALEELALRPGWPSMMRGYLNENARYDKVFGMAGISVATSRCAMRTAITGSRVAPML